MTKQHLQLSPADHDALLALLHKGTLPVKVFKRATALLALQRGHTFQQVAATVQVNHNTVAQWRRVYQIHGLQVLADKPRSGRPLQIEGLQRAKITALACSQAPAGHAQWSLRLLADKIVELGYCEHISHSQVRTILKKTNFSRT